MPKPVPVRAGEMLAQAFKTDVGDRVFFAEGSAALGTRARVALEAQASWLKRHSSLRVVIEGYADDPGNPEANAALAQARAEAVMERLASLGVPTDRMRVAVHGRTSQAVVCADQICAAPNRRVVTRIVVPAGPAATPESMSDTAEPGIRPALRRLF